MKGLTNLILGLLLITTISNAQMIRKEKLTPAGGVYYIEYTPKNMTPLGVVLFLHGTGEVGNNQLAYIDRNDPTKSFVNSTQLEVPYIVIAPQLNMALHSAVKLWLPNDYNPIIPILQSYKLPIHATGLSLGAIALPGLAIQWPGVFSTIASVAGKVEQFNWPLASSPSEMDNALPIFKKIPTKFYYGTSDNVIAYGFSSMQYFSKVLIQAGADNTFMTFPGRGHDIWPDSYKDYWPWLKSKEKASSVILPGIPDPIPVVTFDSAAYKKGISDFKAKMIEAINSIK